ncbi:CDP-glycerol glycerophosphotransferase family protein [Escherichia coli]
MHKYISYTSSIVYKYNKKWSRIIDLLERFDGVDGDYPAYINYNLGLAYCKTKRWGKAISPLEKAIRQKPNKLNWVFRYAIALQNNGKKKQAADVFTNAIEKHGDDDKKLYSASLLLLGFSRPREAEKALRKAIDINPNSYKYYLALLICLNKIGQGRSWQAVNIIERALKINPNASELYYSLGLNYEHMKNYPMAIISYIKAIFVKGNTESLSDVLSGLRKQLDDLVKDESKTESVKLHTEGITILYTEPEESEQLFRKAIELYENETSYYSSLALSLELQGDTKLWQELDILEKALSHGEPKPKHYYRLGVVRQNLNKFKYATDAYEVALKKGFVNTEIYYRLGYCLERLNNLDNANKAYERAIIQDNKAKTKRFGIGVLHNRFGKRDLTIKAFKELSLLKVDDAELFYKLGMAYDRRYEWNNACEAYMHSISINPQVYELQFRLGFVYERLGNYAQSTHWYHNAIMNSNSDNIEWYYRLGIAYYNNLEFENACVALLKTDSLGAKEILENDECLRKDILEVIPYVISENKNKVSILINRVMYFRQISFEHCHLLIGYLLYIQKRFEIASRYYIETKVLKEPHGVSDKKYKSNANIKQLSDYNHFYQNDSLETFILYESFQGGSISCNPLAIFRTLISHPSFLEFHHVWVINEPDCIPNDILDNINVSFVRRNSTQYLKCLASAKIVINNSTFPYYFIKKEHQIYINTWHGTPVKTLGKDMKGRFLEHKNFTRNILQSDFLLSPNKFTTNILIQSHDINGIYSGEILETGYPRIDLTINITDKRKQEILEQIGIEHTSSIVLYAPTWRGTHGDIGIDKNKISSDLELLASIENATIIFRGHSLLEDKLNDLNINNVFIAPKTVDTNELLGCVDILITDYSSIFFDYYPTGKPVFFYAYDLLEYEKDRGLYFSLDSLPGQVCHDIITLKRLTSESIKNNYKLCFNDSLNQHCFNEYDDGKATSRFVNCLIEKVSNTSNTRKSLNYDKKSYLFYAGPFMRNGITTSFVNLANNLSELGHTISVVIDPSSISKHPDRMEQLLKLSQKINIIGRVGGMNLSVEDRFIHSERNRDYYLPNSEMYQIWKNTWKIEFKRIFGDSKFDCIINFEGYTSFWSSLFSSQDSTNRVIYQHNDMFSEFSKKYPYLEATFQTYRDYNKVISVSKETRDLNRKNLASVVTVHDSKFEYSENLLNLDNIFALANERILESDEFIFSGSGPVFINIGRLSVEKDHAKLLYAFRKVVNSVHDAKLVILGEGALQLELNALVNKLNLSDSVFLLGHRFNPYPYLYKSNCFVLSSNHEGQPMTLLEALTLSIDVIATSIAGNNSVLKLIDETGVENSIDGLAEAMIDYSQHGKNQKKFNYQSYQYKSIENFIALTQDEIITENAK